MNEKDFMKGFLQFLQAKYGAPERKPSTQMYGNTPRMPLFQEEIEPGGPQMEMPQGMQQGMQGMQQMAQPPQAPMQPQQLGQEMNQMFPMRRDPLRMN